MRSVICLLISALLISTTGCMTMRPLQATTALTDAIKVGDKVEKVDGGRLRRRGMLENG